MYEKYLEQLEEAGVPHMILEHKLPTVLTMDEIDRLMDAVDDLKYRAMFATMYSSGMRVSEVIHLHVDKISVCIFLGGKKIALIDFAFFHDSTVFAAIPVPKKPRFIRRYRTIV